MYDFFNKHGLTVFALLGAAIVLITVIIFGSSDASELNDIAKYSTGTNFGLRSIYIIGISCAVLAVALPIAKSLSEPKKLLKPVIGIVAIGIVFLICWAMASDSFDVVKFGPETDFDLTSSGSKMVGGMIITMYALIVIAIVGIIATEIMKLFK